MLGPYREPVLNEPDALPDTCVPEGERTRPCPHASSRAPARLPAAYARALSASATVLLLVASASLAALTWTVTSTILADRADRADRQERSAAPRPPPLVPQAYTPRLPRASEPPVLAELGKEETHDPDALWTRAEHAASSSPLTLARARLAPGALAPAWLPGSIQFEHRPGGRTGMRVLASPEGSYTALLGLRKGDLITAIDGFTFRHPEDVLSAYAELRFGRSTVIELERAGRGIVLRVDAPAQVGG